MLWCSMRMVDGGREEGRERGGRNRQFEIRRKGRGKEGGDEGSVHREIKRR